METRLTTSLTYLLILLSVNTRSQVPPIVANQKIQATRDITTKKTIQRYILPDGKAISEDKLDSIYKAWGSFNMKRDVSEKTPDIYLTPRGANNDLDQNRMAIDFNKKWLGTMAPDFSLKDITNQTITLSRQKGKVVVLNFWFTECKPCIQEMPELNKMAKSFDDSKVTFLAIALNKREMVESFLKSTTFHYRILPDGKMDTRKYEIYSWPTHMVIDRSGRIRFLQIGGTNIRAQLTEAINSALGIPIAARTQDKDSLITHVDSALNILKKNSLYSNRVDWKAVEKRVHVLAKGKKSKAETFAALKIAFDALGDKHAAFYHYDNQYRVDNSQLTERYSDSLKSEWKKGPRILAKMVGGQAYLRIPFIGANNQQTIDKMADTINKAVQLMAKNNPKGWIIDLRLNAGGNIRPMMAGLGSFFKDGVLGYYLDSHGKPQECSSIKRHKFLIDNKVQAHFLSPTADLTQARVALLIGPGTGSSGEALAVNFQARPNTALFGQPTAGLANSTDGFVFSDNNAYFLISVSRLGDRNKKVLPEGVLPDYEITPNDHFSDLSSDSATKAARIWVSMAEQHHPVKKKTQIQKNIKTTKIR